MLLEYPKNRTLNHDARYPNIVHHWSSSQTSSARFNILTPVPSTQHHIAQLRQERRSASEPNTGDCPVVWSAGGGLLRV
jgi:hypothetical protein